MAGNDDRAFGVDELQMNVKQSKSLVGTEKRVSIHVTGPGYDKAGSDDGEWGVHSGKLNVWKFEATK